MKYMKLGIGPDTFHTEEATRTVISDAASDLIIQINNINYLLHKHQLVPKSGLLQKLCFSDSETTSFELHDIPGGEEAFEVCAKFCYGITINLGAHNIVPSLCASKFLRMTEAIHNGNLGIKLETFFDSCILRGWKDSVLALNTTSKVPEWSKSLGIVRRCIDSVVDKILTPPPKVTWSYTYTRSSYTQRNHKFVPKDWWTEDISNLDVDLFRCIIATVESTKTLPPQMIGEALHVYACRWLSKSSRNSLEAPESSSSASENKDSRKRIIEIIVSMIPGDEGSVSVGFLLRLLRLAYVAVGVSPATKAELVRRCGQKLEEAPVKDLIIYNFHDTDYLYNFEMVEAVLESFVAQWRRRREKHSMALRSIEKIGKLIDAYLQVVATNTNMPVPKFMSLAKALPEIARPDHDGLYRAIHIYLTEHPETGKAEKKQLCSVLDLQKLSMKVREQAARNEQLPLRTVVQLLFFEQKEMKSTTSQTQVEHDQRIASHEIKEAAKAITTRHKTSKIPEKRDVFAQLGSSSTSLDNNMSTKNKNACQTHDDELEVHTEHGVTYIR